MIIAIVVAVSENGVIGRAGGLPWRLSSDLKLFKKITMGKPIVMGRKTFQSIGRALPGRTNIVVTRDRTFEADNVVVAGDLETALEMARDVAGRTGADEVCVVGGGEIYMQALPVTDRIYRTQIHMSVEGDTRFPDLGEDDWREVERTFFPASENDNADFTLAVLERRPGRG